jgi:hypothetical protein
MTNNVKRKIKLNRVYISFPKVLKPGKALDGTMKYSAQFIIPKDHPQVKELQTLIKEIAAEAFAGIPLKVLKIGLRDNDKETNKSGVVFSEATPRLKKTLFLNAYSVLDFPPQAVDNGASGSVRLITSEADLYAGCLVNVALTLLSFKQTTAQGIGFGLNTIQVVEKGERWDGRVSALDEWAPIPGAKADVPAAAPAEEAVDEDDGDPWS